MRAFEVHLNGEKLALIGIGHNGVLSAVVTWVSGHGKAGTNLRLGGLISETDEHVTWRNRAVHNGDEIKIKIVEAGAVDKPRKRHRYDPDEQIKWQKQQVRQLAKKFGWKIQTRPGKAAKAAHV